MMHWIIGVIIAAVVVLGGGYYVMNSGSLSMSEESTVDDPAEQQADSVAADKATPKLAEKAVAFSGSFFDLATRSGNYACTISSSGPANGTKGTVYVSGTNVRGDFTTVAAGKTVDSHMLKLDNKVYVWGGGMEQGMVMDATTMSGTGSDPAMTGSGKEMQQEYGWNCVATGSDASKFVKPTNIEFMDLGAMMQGMGSIPGAR